MNIFFTFQSNFVFARNAAGLDWGSKNREHSKKKCDEGWMLEKKQPH